MPLSDAGLSALISQTARMACCDYDDEVLEVLLECQVLRALRARERLQSLCERAQAMRPQDCI